MLIRQTGQTRSVGVRSGEGINADTRESYLRQNDFLEWVKKRSGEIQYMSDEEIRETYLWEKTLEFENKEIEFYLTQAFSFAEIKTPFEYAIIKDGVVQDGAGKKSGKNDFLKSNYRVRLFPDNILRKNIILSVIFPERTNYVLGSMIWILGGSTLFSLFILATFALSLYFIIQTEKDI